MIPSFTLTHQAENDLNEIGRYTQKRWGRAQRDFYLRMLDAAFQQLAADPLTGTDCSDIREGYRKFNVGGHLIFCRQTTGGILDVVRVLHSRMDIETQLSAPR